MQGHTMDKFDTKHLTLVSGFRLDLSKTVVGTVRLQGELQKKTLVL